MASTEGDPFDLFPLKVWKVILKKVEGYPEDLCNFLQVYPCLYHHLSQPNLCFDLMLNRFPNLLPKEALLNCRRVCQYWRHSLNQFLQNHPTFQSPGATSESEDIETESIFQWNWPTSTIKLRGRGRGHQQPLLQFWSTFQSSATNPFFGATATFEYDYGDDHADGLRVFEDAESFFDTLKIILERFGLHLWHVSISLVYANWSAAITADLYRKWVQCLNLMPNLRTLKLIDYVVKLGDPEDESPRLNNAFLQNPLPELPRLESLDVGKLLTHYTSFCTKNFSPHLTVKHILGKYCVLLKRFGITKDLWYSLNYFGAGELGQLRELCFLPLWTSYIEFPLLCKIVDLLESTETLEKLKIPLWNRSCFELLQILKGGLIKVRVLSVHKLDHNYCRREMPKMEEIPVVNTLESFSIEETTRDCLGELEEHFLNYLPNLKYLKIKRLLRGKGKQEWVVKWVEVKMAEMWGRLSRLQVLSVGGTKYRR